MKRVLFVLLLILPVLFAHAQQPPPKNPTDPDMSIIIPADTISKSLSESSKVFTAVEQEPTFPGGIEKFFEYIGRNIRYPENARKNHIQGKVYISFVIEKDGSLSDFKVLKSPSPDLDAEAIRLLKACPKWNPGMQNGSPVRFRYNMPIIFRTPGY